MSSVDNQATDRNGADFEDLKGFDGKCSAKGRRPWEGLRASGNGKPLSELLEQDILPLLTADLVFTHPTHKWQKTETKWRGACPWHASDSGTSFNVTLDGLRWFCAGCCFGGGPVQYRYRLRGGKGSPRGVEFVDTVRELAALAGVPFPERELSDQEREQARRREADRAALVVAYDHCQKVLWSPAGEQARAYLHGRGFTEDDFRELGLGFYDHRRGVADALRRAGFTDDDLKTTPVLGRQLEGYIIFPWPDDRGQPLTLYGTWPDRKPPADTPKKMAMPGEGTKRSPLYFDRARKAGHRSLVLVEGLTDAGLLQCRGDTRVVSPVANLLSREQAQTLARHKVERVVICLDPDGGGAKGVPSCIRTLETVGIAAYVAPWLPDGLDPDDFVNRHGIAAWRAHVEQAEHAYRWSARDLVTRHGLGGDQATDQLLDAAVNEAVAFAANRSPGRDDELSRHFWPEIAEATGADLADLKARVRLARGTVDPGQKPGATEYRFAPIDSATFASSLYKLTWLVARMLVEGQPVVVGGPRKSLKTSLVIALVVALGSGTHFLGPQGFKVYRRLRVAILSGESGEAVIQETARRICKASGLDLASLDVLWDFKLPQLANPDHVAALQEGLRERGVQVIVVDPLYLCLLAGVQGREIEAANLFQMGPLLLGIAEACKAVGCTPILIHHTRKNLAHPYEPMELEDLAFAGIQEFARQWLLVNRREKYEDGTGVHKLWLSAGGSAGKGGLWAVDIDEGQMGEDFGGRKWEVTVESAAKAREAAAEQGDSRKRQKPSASDKADEAALLKALDALDTDNTGVSYTKVREAARLSSGRMTRATTRLTEEGLIQELPVKVAIGSEARRECRGLRRPPPRAFFEEG